jgi:2'-5' RNA ligase
MTSIEPWLPHPLQCVAPPRAERTWEGGKRPNIRMAGQDRVNTVLDMKLAIVAFPELDQADRQWIEAIRRIHDPQATRIAVHFTLVFPLDGSIGELESEIEAVSRAQQPIQFVIRQAAAVPDTFSRLVHVFLVPDEGAARIAELHDNLYAGRLRSHLRPDLAYVPHMTVGVAEDVAGAERLASEVNERARGIRGQVANLHLVAVDGARVRALSSLRLGDGAGAVG